MNDWQEVKLGEIGKIVTGKTPKTSIIENYGNDILFLTPSDDMTVRKVYTTKRKLSKLGLSEVKNFLLPKNSVCVSCIGSDLGKVVITTKNTVTNQQINSIIPFDICNFDFLYYSLLILGEHLNFISKTSTAVPIINKSDFSNFKISLPPLPEQKAIAATLSCLDDMIELNNRTNKILEEMAQAIFKRWFVDFEFPNEDGQPYKSSGGEMTESELGEIPMGWRVGSLSELIDTTISGDWGKDSEQNNFTEKVVCVRGADIPEIENGNKGNAPYRYILKKNRENKSLGANELIVEISGGSPTQSTGRCSLISDELINSYDVPILCTNFCRAIKFKKNTYSHFAYRCWKYLYITDVFFQYENGTTGIKNLDLSGILEKEKIVLPFDSLMEEFKKTISVFMKNICGIARENNSLIEIRNSLLPKLMSGEIRVPVEED